MTAATGREVALKILTQVRENDAYANLVAPTVLQRAGLHGQEAGLALEIAFGALRWQGWYEAILQECCSRPLSEVQAELRDILLMGTHQLLKMRIPAHAAVDTSCTLARKVGEPGGAKGRAGFVNAILRKVGQHDQEQWADALGVADATVQALAIRGSHPEWIVSAYADCLGGDLAQVRDLLQANNTPARPVLAARPGRCEVEELLSIDHTSPGLWSELAVRMLSGQPVGIPAVTEHRAIVQDEGSQLVTLAFANAEVSEPDEQWLDMCAGPGGKAALLASIAQVRGAHLTCCELHEHRAELVRSTVDQPNVTILTGDAMERPWGSRLFDRVLLDAPCSGLGALRRRPEARWRKQRTDLPALTGLQRSLLEIAISSTRVGGVIGYVTCSPHLAETELVVSAALKAHPEATLLDATALVPQSMQLLGPTVQFWPHRHHTDAMFLALIRKEG